MNVDDTIKGRDASYGPFAKQAGMAQTLKAIMRTARGWDNLDSDMKEALDMIAAKMSRVLIGDSKVADSWHDIAGYARLVELRLQNVAQSGNVPEGVNDYGQANRENTQCHSRQGFCPGGPTLPDRGQEPRQERFGESFGQWIACGESNGSGQGTQEVSRHRQIQTTKG